MPQWVNSCFVSMTIILVVFSYSAVQGQEEHGKQEEHSTLGHQTKHRIAAMIGHTHVPLGFDTSAKRDFLVVPTWGLSYDYRIANRWSLGLHTELESATYIIEHSEGIELERERPFKLVLATMYNPWEALVLEAGVGYEFETNKNFVILRLGVGYEIEIGNNWDFAPGLFLDFKEEIYTSWTIGLQVGKQF